MRSSGDERACYVMITWSRKGAEQTGAEREGCDPFWAVGGTPKIAMSDSATSFTACRLTRKRDEPTVTYILIESSFEDPIRGPPFEDPHSRTFQTVTRTIQTTILLQADGEASPVWAGAS